MFQCSFVKVLVIWLIFLRCILDALLGRSVLEHLFLESELDVLVVCYWLFVRYVLRSCGSAGLSGGTLNAIESSLRILLALRLMGGLAHSHGLLYLHTV